MWQNYANSQNYSHSKLPSLEKLVAWSDNNRHFENLLGFAKRSHHSDYCLDLTQESQSESNDLVKFVEKSDLDQDLQIHWLVHQSTVQLLCRFLHFFLRTPYFSNWIQVFSESFILFITCQQPILNSESTNLFHDFFCTMYKFLIKIKIDNKMFVILQKKSNL